MKVFDAAAITRLCVFEAIDQERDYQEQRWGTEFDNKNTPNDWVAYITARLGTAVTMPWDGAQFRKAMLEVAALATAVLERNEYAARHYDQ